MVFFLIEAIEHINRIGTIAVSCPALSGTPVPVAGVQGILDDRGSRGRSMRCDGRSQPPYSSASLRTCPQGPLRPAPWRGSRALRMPSVLSMPNVESLQGSCIAIYAI